MVRVTVCPSFETVTLQEDAPAVGWNTTEPVVGELALTEINNGATALALGGGGGGDLERGGGGDLERKGGGGDLARGGDLAGGAGGGPCFSQRAGAPTCGWLPPLHSATLRCRWHPAASLPEAHQQQPQRR